MEKQEYIKAHPKSYLAASLSKSDIRPDQKIIICNGLIAPKTKQSNLFQLLSECESNQYIVGGRAGKSKTQGYFFAVVDNRSNNEKV